ncbi:MAG: hypothetical protein LBT27_08690 [Prevotellaceae bacterium]|jgi:hypothetical protein|nr:hypothetical protein [Prevotellaceae bacterium]
MDKNNPFIKFGQILLGLVIIALLVFAASNIGKFGKTNNHDAEVNKTITDMIKKYNDNAPFMISEGIRFENITALPNRILQYNLSFINMTVDEININNFESEIPVIINQIRTNPDMEYFRKNKMSLQYSYKDKDGVFVTNIDITPDMYE